MALPVIPIILKELGGDLRTVTLIESTLPRDGGETTLGVQVREKTTWYPGSAVPSQQVLGPQYQPIVFSGIFEDRKIGAPGAAFSLASLLEDMAEKGHELLFIYGPIIRRASWRTFDWIPKELPRIPYRVELTNLGPRTTAGRRIIPGLRVIPKIGQAVALVSAAKGIAESVASVPEFVRSNIDAALAKVTRVQEKFESLATLGGTFDRGQAQDAVADLDSAEGEIKKAYGGLNVASTDDSLLPDFEVATEETYGLAELHVSLVSSRTELGEVRQQAGRLARETQRGRLYVASQGQTLQRIAAETYGDFEKASDIAEANNKRTWTVAAGEILCLPDAPTPSERVPAL